MSASTFIAIIPAAGHSRRMGRPKLLLPWRGTTVIAHLVGELLAAGVQPIFVVLRASDDDLRAAVVSAGAIPIQPQTDPPDMQTSVEQGLNAARQAAHSCGSVSGWFLIPADHPIVTRHTIGTLCAGWKPGWRQILIPTFKGQRGHPTLFSADFAREVTEIPADQGLNWLVRRNAVSIKEIPVDDAGVLADLDTPEDYQALLDSAGQSP